MGIFSGKVKRYYSTTVQRMIEDDQIVFSSQGAINNYLFSGGGRVSTSVFSKSLPDHIIEAAQNALPARLNRAYRAAKQGRYASLGLPKCESVSRDAVNIEAVVRDYLEDIVGAPVSMLYTEVQEAQPYHVMWQLLIDNYGYNPDTNELEGLTASVGFTCYLTRAVLFFCQTTADAVIDDTFYDAWGYSTEFGETIDRTRDTTRDVLAHGIDPVATEDYVVLTYEYNEVVADTTAPIEFKASSFDGLLLKGVAEIDSIVRVYDVTDVELASAVADGTGYCEVTLPTTTADIHVRVEDSSGNLSTILAISNPHDDPTHVGITGDSPTVTIVKREEQLNFNLLPYMPPLPLDDEPTVYAPNPDYIQAAYTYELAGVPHLGYLTYEYGSETIPVLDDLFQLTEAAGEFYPRVYARLNTDNLSMIPKTDPKYKDSVRMGKVLGIEWKGWVEGVHEGIAEADGISTGEVKQAFMMVGAPMNTEDPVLAEYLFRYFHKSYNEMDTPLLTSIAFKDPALDLKSGLYLEIKDQVYTQVLMYEYLGLKRVSGSIGEVGTYSAHYVSNMPLGTRRTRGFILSKPNKCHIYRWQDTVGSYLEIQVFSASTAHRFNGGSSYQNGKDDALIIPLDRSALPKMNQKEKEILFAKCMHMFINVLKTVKEKWYQTGIFKIVMLIIVVIISVVTYGAGAGAAWTAYGAIMAAVTAVAISVAISLVIKIVAKVLVGLGVDSKVFAVIAVIIAIIAIAVGASSNVAELLNTSADVLLQVSNAAFALAGSMSNMELMETVKQMDVFQAQAASKMEMLDKAREMLETGTVPIDLEVLMGDLRSKVMINLGESADTFLTRTIGLSNVGTLAFDMVGKYVDSKLTLPDLNYTMSKLNRG